MMGHTVHSLMHGSAICGFPGFPATWPEGHLWSTDKTAINCPRCKELLDEGLKDSSAQAEAERADKERRWNRLQQSALDPAENLVDELINSTRSKPKFHYSGTPLRDVDPCPVKGKHHLTKMQNVPSSYLDWLEGQDWFRHKYPAVQDYINRSRSAINQDLKHKDRQ